MENEELIKKNPFAFAYRTSNIGVLDTLSGLIEESNIKKIDQLTIETGNSQMIALSNLAIAEELRLIREALENS